MFSLFISLTKCPIVYDPSALLCSLLPVHFTFLSISFLHYQKFNITYFVVHPRHLIIFLPRHHQKPALHFAPLICGRSIKKY
jgi:hypothetical protein